MKEDLAIALEKSCDDLYIDLGRDLFSSQKGALPLPIKRYKEAAKQWYIDNHAQLKKKICSDERVINYINDAKSKNRVLLGSAILDLISSIVTGVSPVTVTALIVNEGIESFCAIQ